MGAQNAVKTVVAAAAGREFAFDAVVVRGRVDKTEFGNCCVHAGCGVAQVLVEVAHDEQLIACSLQRSEEGVEIFAEGFSRIGVLVAGSS